MTNDVPSRMTVEVVAAVRVAATGEILFSPTELQRLLVAEPREVVLDEPLTARELEVLRQLANGASTTAAAAFVLAPFASCRSTSSSRAVSG